jgi:four helix bundle protein
MGHSVAPAVVQGYRDLLVWRRSVDLVLEIYDATENFPRREVYGLVAQMRRAAVSVPSKIAEGHGRDHLGDYLHHLSIANGSLMEVETQVVIAIRRGYLGIDMERRLLECSAEVGRMLAGLTRPLKRLHRRPRSDT